MIRFKFKHTTVECMLARLLASVAAGIVVGVATPPVAQQFQATLSPFVPTVLGLITGVLTWFATRRVFAFTADCLNVPGTAPAFQGGTKPQRAETTPRRAPTAAPSAARTVAPAPTTTGSDTAVLETFPQEDGSVKVCITVKGLTKREFNALRGRLEQVRGVNWSHPANLHDGRRKLEGVLPAGPARPDALRKLEELTGNRV